MPSATLNLFMVENVSEVSNVARGPLVNVFLMSFQGNGITLYHRSSTIATPDGRTRFEIPLLPVSEIYTQDAGMCFIYI